MRRQWIGLCVLALLALAALVVRRTASPGKPAVVLKGYVGGEKIDLLDDPEVKRLLARRYGLSLDCAKVGSIEMVSGSTPPDVQFLWPSSQLALELFRIRRRGAPAKSEVILYSPIVLYAWAPAAEALEKSGFAEDRNGILLLSGFAGLARRILEGSRWSELGLRDTTSGAPIVSGVAIVSTDPARSNSGNMFAGLLANSLAGRVCTLSDLDSVVPPLRAYFEKLGYMERTSSDLFDRFLVTGLGALPVIAGYENQIIETAMKHGKKWNRVGGRIRILYPVPTVWSAHPVILLKPEAEPLLAALTDPDFQAAAWERHGFRTGMMGVQNDLSGVGVRGIAESVAQVIPMPSAAVMDTLIRALENR